MEGANPAVPKLPAQLRLWQHQSSSSETPGSIWVTLSLEKSGIFSFPLGKRPELCQQLGANGKQMLGAGRESSLRVHPSPGYTVSSVISTTHERIYVAGAPRFNHTGKVILFNMHSNRNLTIHQALKGEQVIPARNAALLSPHGKINPLPRFSKAGMARQRRAAVDVLVVAASTAWP